MKRVNLWALCGIFIVVFVFVHFSFPAYNMFYSFVTRFRSKTALIVKNLIALTQGASIGDLTSLEELVGFCVFFFTFFSVFNMRRNVENISDCHFNIFGPFLQMV